jgi:hypothetical protein
MGRKSRRNNDTGRRTMQRRNEKNTSLDESVLSASPFSPKVTQDTWKKRFSTTAVPLGYHDVGYVSFTTPLTVGEKVGYGLAGAVILSALSAVIYVFGGNVIADECRTARSKIVYHNILPKEQIANIEKPEMPWYCPE